MTTKRTGFLPRGVRAALAALGASAVLAAGAFAQEPPVPRPGEIRLTLKLNERSVSFTSTLEPLVRKTVAFEGKEYAPTDAMRATVAELRAALPEIGPQTGLVVTAYSSDPTVAYRRARAVRGELIERHQLPAGAIVAAGRAAPGHVGGATIVDVHVVDPAQCVGCGPTPFRAIAFDSGTMRLVTALPEMLASQANAPSTDAPPVAQAAPAAPPRSAAAPSAPQALPKAPERVAPARPVEAERPKPPTRPATGGCRRPRIIIDDYYPGGPMVPCPLPATGRNG